MKSFHLMILSLCVCFGVEAEKGPNFVIILADDLGYSDLGCYGGEIQTPVLDRLAENGLRFSQMYSTGRCWPSRAALMTGYYPGQVGMDPRDRLEDWPKWTRTLPFYFKDAGYRSYISGKWHLRHHPAHETQGGFDRSYQLKDHDRFFSPNQHLLDNIPLPKPDSDSGYYSTIAIADYAIDFLKQHSEDHRERPFVLYAAFTAPHFPLHALEEDIQKYANLYDRGWDEMRKERFDRMKKMDLYGGALADFEPEVTAHWSLSIERLKSEINPGEVGRAIPWAGLTEEEKQYEATKMAIHAAMVDRMDHEIGRIMAQVEAMGEAENTVFVFMSDNGASAEQMHRGDMHDQEAPLGSDPTYMCLGPGWSTHANTPFSLHKHWVHEGGVSSPFIIHWPEGIRSVGGIRHSPSHFIDVLPTLLDLAGIDPELKWNEVAAPPLPGISLVSIFDSDLEGGFVDREIYFNHHDNEALRVGMWKIVRRRLENREVRWELYNIEEDRAEKNDLSEKLPNLKDKLVKRWSKLTHQYQVIDYNSGKVSEEFFYFQGRTP